MNVTARLTPSSSSARTVTVEIDRNADGTADITTSSIVPAGQLTGSVQVPLTNLNVGNNPLKVRAKFGANTSSWVDGNALVRNDSPAFAGSNPSSFSILENWTGNVGTLTVTDPNPGDSVQSLSIVTADSGPTIDGQNMASRFAISNAGVISLTEPLNHEDFLVAGNPANVTLKIKATDTNQLSSIYTVSIVVGNAHEVSASGVSQTTGGMIKLANGSMVHGLNSVNADWALSPRTNWIGQDANGNLTLPNLFVTQSRGVVNNGENSDEWGQAQGVGSGTFSSNGTHPIATSSVTIATSRGNACNSVNNTAVGTSEPIDSGTLGWFVRGFSAGTYDLVFKVNTTINVTGSVVGSPVSANVSWGGNGFLHFNGTGGDGSASNVSYKRVSVTIATANSTPHMVFEWHPTVSIGPSRSGTVQVTGTVSLEEISKQ